MLACIRYIELNPVRARMVADPEEYVWSSYRARIGHGSCSWLDPASGLESIKRNGESMVESYVQYVRSAIPGGEWDLKRTAAVRSPLTRG
jgi:putative transposase